jgi:hypothetical protein
LGGTAFQQDLREWHKRFSRLAKRWGGALILLESVGGDARGAQVSALLRELGLPWKPDTLELRPQRSFGVAAIDMVESVLTKLYSPWLKG